MEEAMDGASSSSSELNGVLGKLAAFLLVQALVCVILIKSSSVFSSLPTRSVSFRRIRSASIRRLLAALSDLPAGDKPSAASSNSETAQG
ncbi:hypothetical protein MUK42_35274 [Musa troglodytarum]|uniref:Uncharacterized protein n=1 Tax=Musa troglodytarum TaxID=320322 RepID=A0A9E7HSY2_9LILI|nr:hypothetical protein MUK42_35274 [Musa troglodytarum]